MAKTVWRAFLKTAGILVHTGQKGSKNLLHPVMAQKCTFMLKPIGIRGRMKLYETEAGRAFYKL